MPILCWLLGHKERKTGLTLRHDTGTGIQFYPQVVCSRCWAHMQSFKRCDTLMVEGQCGNPASMDCQYCLESICEGCSFGYHEYGRCKDRD